MAAAAPYRTVDAITYGVGIRIRLPEQFSGEPGDLLPPGAIQTRLTACDLEFGVETAEQSQGCPDAVTIRLGRRTVPGRMPPAEGLRLLRKHIQLRVAELCPNRVFIHAGVVVWNGRAIICPGPSFAGKSTLVWSMVNAGATYFSDEYAVLDDNGSTEAFPVPVSLRSVNGGKQMISPLSAAFGWTEAVKPGLVVFARYSRGAQWKPRVVSPGRAVLGLLRNSIAIRRAPGRVLHAISRVAENTPAYTGKYSDSAVVTEWIRTFLPAAAHPRHQTLAGGGEEDRK